jgi:hypothetical protein
MTTVYQEALSARLKTLQLVAPPVPWHLVASIAIGGFEALGFSSDSRHLLVVSSSGRGVFDSTSGERVARDSSNSTGSWYNLEALTVEGIGPLSGQSIQIAGIHGGGLPLVTLDGWMVDLLSPCWPASFVTLSPPGSSPWIQDQAQSVAKVAPIGGDDVVKCFGFSWSRTHLVVATGHAVDLFLR